MAILKMRKRDRGVKYRYGRNFHIPKDRILLIRLSSLGDVVLTSPAIRAVRKHFPDSYIAMLVGKQSADVLMENPHLDEVITLNRKAANRNIGETHRVVAELRRRKFDLTIDFQRKFRTSLLAYLSGAKYRVGYHQPCGALCVVRVPDRVNKHAIERNFDLLSAIGLHADTKEMELFLTDTDRKYAEAVHEAPHLSVGPASQILASAVIDSRRLKLGLFPGAGWKHREWKPERFAAIGDLAYEHFGAQTLIFGGPNEKDLVDKVAGYMMYPSVRLAGNLKIRQLAALIEKCDVFVTNDTGPMHIAVAMKTPTVALFGPGNHVKFQPIGQAHTTIRHNVPCSPCKQFTDKCKDNICMKLITVDEVWEVLFSLLKRN